jgi:hypothetical protein
VRRRLFLAGAVVVGLATGAVPAASQHGAAEAGGGGVGVSVGFAAVIP